MKKFIVLGIVLTMVMGLAAMANAGALDTQWTVLMKAGIVSNYSGTGDIPSSPNWVQAFNLAQLSLIPTGVDSTANSAGNFGSNQSGIHFGLPSAGATKRIVTSKKAYIEGVNTYTWNMKLETAAGWTSSPLVVGWYVPTEAENFVGWTITAYRNGEEVGTMSAPTKFATNGVGATNVLAYITNPNIAAGVTEDWTFVASVPEPGSMVAMLSGLVGLVGFGIRRRK